MAQFIDNRGWNCGGFALQTRTWYIPHDNWKYGYDIWDYITEQQDFIPTDNDGDIFIANRLVHKDIDCILNDFPNLKRVSYKDIDWSKKIIAYRVFYETDEDNFEDYDFHFKYWNTKTWSEKMGGGEIHHCNLDEDSTWFYDFDDFSNKDIEVAREENHNYHNYNSEIIYFQYND